MKLKITVFAVVAALFLGISTHAKAQFDPENGQVGFNVGLSAIGMLFNLMSFSEVAEMEVTSLPTFQFSYDYRVGDKFSIGAAFSFAHTSMTYNDPTIGNVQDGEFQNFDLKLNRLTLGARGLFYYTDSDNLDLYSGVRLGVNMWPVKASSTDPDLDLGVNPLGDGIFSNAVFPNVQFIYFGGTAFVTDNIGINWELCAGQPYFAAVGVRYRFD